MRTLLCALVLTTAAQAQPALAQPPSSAAALDHVAIYVSDPDRSAAFYKEIFGLKQVPAPVSLARWLVLSNGTMLHIVAGRTSPVVNSKWDHFALACADMQAMIATLDAKGINWWDDQGNPKPRTREDCVQQIFTHDPEGYWVEINDMKPSGPVRSSPKQSTR